MRNTWNFQFITVSNACAKCLQQTVGVCRRFLRLVCVYKPGEIPNIQKLEETGTHGNEIFAKSEFNEKLESEEESKPQWETEGRNVEGCRLKGGVSQAITSLRQMLFAGQSLSSPGSVLVLYSELCHGSLSANIKDNNQVDAGAFTRTIKLVHVVNMVHTVNMVLKENNFHISSHCPFTSSLSSLLFWGRWGGVLPPCFENCSVCMFLLR